MHWLAALLRPRYFQRLGPAAQSGSGTARSRPSSCRLEPISPSVWSSVRRNTVQRQGGLDRQGRVPRLATLAGARVGAPALDRLLRERCCQATTGTQPRVVLGPVGEPMPLLRDAVPGSEFASKGMVGIPHGSRARPPTRILDHAQPGGLCNKAPLHPKHRLLRHAVAVVTIRK